MRQFANLPIKKHAAMMRIYDQALSPKSTVAMIPIMEEVLRKRVIQWEQCAASGQVSHALDAPLPVQHQHKKMPTVDNQPTNLTKTLVLKYRTLYMISV